MKVSLMGLFWTLKMSKSSHLAWRLDQHTLFMAFRPSIQDLFVHNPKQWVAWGGGSKRSSQGWCPAPPQVPASTVGSFPAQLWRESEVLAPAPGTAARPHLWKNHERPLTSPAAALKPSAEGLGVQHRDTASSPGEIKSPSAGARSKPLDLPGRLPAAWCKIFINIWTRQRNALPCSHIGKQQRDIRIALSHPKQMPQNTMALLLPVSVDRIPIISICGLVHLAPVWASAVSCLPSRLHQGRREEHRDSEQRWHFSLKSRFSWKPSLGGFPEWHLDPSDPCCVFSIIELVLPPPFPVSLAPGTNLNQRPGDTQGSLSVTPLSSCSPSPVDLISQIKPKYLHLSSPSSWLLAELLHSLLLGLSAPVSPSSIHFHKAAKLIVGFHATTKGLLLGKSPVLSMAYKALWGLPPPTSPCPPGHPVPHPSQEEHGPVLWCSSSSPWLSPLPLPTSSC